MVVPNPGRAVLGGRGDQTACSGSHTVDNSCMADEVGDDRALEVPNLQGHIMRGRYYAQIPQQGQPPAADIS